VFPQGPLAPVDSDDDSCYSCETELVGSYYEIDGERVCAPCAKRASAEDEKGTTMASVARAIGFGLIPAAIGAAIWWALLAFADAQAPLFAVGIAYFVGAAVKVASRRADAVAPSSS
jgi:hypothetical protein